GWVLAPPQEEPLRAGTPRQETAAAFACDQEGVAPPLRPLRNDLPLVRPTEVVTPVADRVAGPEQCGRPRPEDHRDASPVLLVAYKDRLIWSAVAVEVPAARAGIEVALDLQPCPERLLTRRPDRCVEAGSAVFRGSRRPGQGEEGDCEEDGEGTKATGIRHFAPQVET